MKIGYDAKRLFCNSTGLGNYSRTIVKNYARYFKNNELFLFTPSIKLNELSEKLKKGFELILPKHTFFWRSFRILRDLKKNKIEIYHGLSNELPFGIHQTSIKSVVTIHDLIFKVYPKTYPIIDRIIYDFKFKYACKHADKIIAISESTKKDIIKFYGTNPNKIEILYQSALEDYYELADKDEIKELQQEFNLPEKFMISVGTIEERKNLKSTLRAIAQLEHKIPLIIIGGGKKYKQEVLDLIQELHLEKRIIFLQRKISNKELRTLYQLAELSLYPSMYEGFGLPVLESQLVKTPVITSNTSSLIEAAAKYSIKVNPNDEKQIKQGIEYLLSLPEDRRNDIKEKIFLESHKKFSSEKLSEQLNFIYVDLLN